MNIGNGRLLPARAFIWLALGAATSALASCGTDRKFESSGDSPPVQSLGELEPGGTTVDVVSVMGGAGGSASAGESDLSDSLGIAGGEASESSAARLTVSATLVDFGPVATGVASLARVTLTNEGGAPLEPPIVELSESTASEFAIVQNQCHEPLQPADACDVRLQLVPEELGVLAGELVISGGSSVPVVVALTGRGVERGELVLAAAPGGSTDLGGVLVGERAEGRFSLTNPLGVESGLLELSVSGAGYSLATPLGEGDCVAGESLVGGASCDVTVGFSPRERGSAEATLTVVSASLGASSLGLTGRGLIPGALQGSTPTLDFGGVVLGEAAADSVTLENAGDTALTFSSLSLLSDGSDFLIQFSDCGVDSTLEPGQTCTVTVEFRPSSASQASTAELVVETADGGRIVVALSGDGLEPGSLVVDPVGADTGDFGRVLLGQRVVQSFRVTNPGAQPSGVLDLRSAGDFAIVVPPRPGDCAAGETSLVDGDSCVVQVAFSPTARSTRSGSLTITSPLAGNTSFRVEGVGITPAELEVEPDQVDFGLVVVGESGQRGLTIRNTGDESMPAPTATIESVDGRPIDGVEVQNGCTQALAFEQTCTVTLTFAPSRPGNYSRVLRLSSSGGGAATTLLLGRAVERGSLELSTASGSSADFGDVGLGDTSAQRFSLRNPGGASLRGALPSRRMPASFRRMTATAIRLEVTVWWMARLVRSS